MDSVEWIGRLSRLCKEANSNLNNYQSCTSKLNWLNVALSRENQSCHLLVTMSLVSTIYPERGDNNTKQITLTRQLITNM